MTDSDRYYRVRFTPELVAQLRHSRTVDGYLLHWEWGESDEYGYHRPTVFRTDDGVPGLLREAGIDDDCWLCK